MVHVATYIIDIGSLNTLGAAYHDIIGGVHTVAAGAVGAQQVVPAIAVDEVGCLAVDGDVLLFVATHAEAGVRVQLDETDSAEIGAIAGPQTTCGGVEQQTRVDGVLVFHTVGGAYLDSGAPLEVGRPGVERLVPHGEDTAAVTAAQTTAGGSIDTEVTVAYLQHVGSCTATRTLSAAMPRPAVVGYDTATASAEGIPLAVAFGEG